MISTLDIDFTNNTFEEKHESFFFYLVINKIIPKRSFSKLSIIINGHWQELTLCRVDVPREFQLEFIQLI